MPLYVSWSLGFNLLCCSKFIFFLCAINFLRGLDADQFHAVSPRKSLEEMAVDYEDDKNSVIAFFEHDSVDLYEDFYEDLDNHIVKGNSMDVIFFGPSVLFIKLDSETILHILSHTHKYRVPIYRTLLAWDIITGGKKATYLQGREYMAFGCLLNYVPEEDLYHTNFGDPSVLSYFSNNYVKLENRKFGVLATAYRRYYGDIWYENGTYINELGYLLCGFPSSDLNKITPNVFKELTDVLSKLNRCNRNQTKTLYNIATHPDAYGHPYKWSSYEVHRLGPLFTRVPRQDLNSIQLEAMYAITPDVMKKIAQYKLQYFSKDQILSMNARARRICILRIQLMHSLDMIDITKKNAFSLRPQVLLGAIFIVTL